MNLKERAQEIALDISAVYLALREKETPLSAKILAWITIAYALSPIDLIPDFIPILGYLDDMILLPLLVSATVKFIPKEIFHKCRAQAQEMSANNLHKHWYYSIFPIVAWIIILWLIIKAFI